jgi:hypothetical protein
VRDLRSDTWKHDESRKQIYGVGITISTAGSVQAGDVTPILADRVICFNDASSHLNVWRKNWAKSLNGRTRSDVSTRELEGRPSGIGL